MIVERDPVTASSHLQFTHFVLINGGELGEEGGGGHRFVSEQFII